jgi:hypothetical protein
MPIRYEKYIRRDMLKAEPDTLWVFGCNFEKEGLGGQAKEMRDEPNAVGIPTKRSPSMSEKAFLSDEDYSEWWAKSEKSVLKLILHHMEGGMIVWPLNDIGTGLADLPRRAPNIMKSIQRIKAKLEDQDTEEDDLFHVKQLEKSKWNGL